MVVSLETEGKRSCGFFFNSHSKQNLGIGGSGGGAGGVCLVCVCVW